MNAARSRRSGRFAWGLALLVCAVAGRVSAQDQVQKDIAAQIVRAFPDVRVVPCPTHYSPLGQFRQAVCLLDGSRSDNELFGDIKARFAPHLISVAALHVVGWKDNAYIYPIKPYAFLPEVSIAIHAETPVSHLPPVPAHYFPTVTAARQAGATPGTPYVKLSDLGSLLYYRQDGPNLSLKDGGHTLHLTLRQGNGQLDGERVVLGAQPFQSVGAVYVPLRGLRPLLCQFQPAASGYVSVNCPQPPGQSVRLMPVTTY